MQFNFDEYLCSMKFTGIYSQAFWVHAETNRSRYSCRGYNYSFVT